MVSLQQLPAAVAAMIGLFVISSNSIFGSAVPDTTVTQVLCNGQMYARSDPFGQSLAYVVSNLEAATPSRHGHDYYNISPYPNAFAYGHAACNRNLTTSDCSSCLDAAATTMLETCPSRIGARSLLHDCSIRYEQYPFTD